VTSLAHITAGDLVTVTSRLGRISRRGRPAYGVVVDYLDPDHFSPRVLVMVEGEQVWCDHRDIRRLNDHPGVSPSSRMRDDE
jgi:hypothetical protein